MKLHNLLVLLLAAVLFACGGKEGSEEGSNDTPKKEMTADAGSLKDGEYAVAEGSTLMWEGKKAAYAHSGTIGVSSGSFSVAEGALTSGEFAIDMASIVNTDVTEEEDRKNLEVHLKSADFFDSEQFPSANFVVKGVKATTEEGATHEVTGDFTLKGKTNEITFPATVAQEGEAITVAASFTIDRTRWEVKFNSPQVPAFANLAADKIISDDIKVEFSLTANMASAE